MNILKDFELRFSRNAGINILGQARFQDWIIAEDVNASVALFNKRADELYKALLTGALNAASIQPGTAALLPLLFSSNATETQAVAWKRVRDQFNPEYNDLLQKKSQPTADNFIDTLLTLETAAQLGSRDEMTIYGITATDSELASSELFAFAGFFDRRYRDHDYDVGRSKAQAFLANPGNLGPIKYTPEPIRTIDATLNGLKLEQMDRDIRISVRDRLRDRAHEILGQDDHASQSGRKPYGYWGWIGQSQVPAHSNWPHLLVHWDQGA